MIASERAEFGDAIEAALIRRGIEPFRRVRERVFFDLGGTLMIADLLIRHGLPELPHGVFSGLLWVAQPWDYPLHITHGLPFTRDALRIDVRVTHLEIPRAAEVLIAAAADPRARGRLRWTSPAACEAMTVAGKMKGTT